MSHTFSHSQLRWAHTTHFAHQTYAPLWEHRLTWVKKKDGDDTTNTPEVPFTIIDKNGETKSPVTEIVGDTRRTVLDEGSLLEGMAKAARNNALSDFFEGTDRQRDILSTVAWGTRKLNSAQRIKDLMHELNKGDAKSAKAIRSELERILTPNKSPEKNKDLQTMIEETRQETKAAESDAKKKEIQKKFLKMIAHEYAKLGPLYPRLASLMSCKEAEHHLGKSADVVFQELSDPMKRLNVLKDLATLRHDLVFQGPENLEKRQQAMEDLFESLRFAQDLLTPQERIEFEDIFVRVGACKIALETYAAKNQEQRDGSDGNDKEKYANKVIGLREFFREEKGRKDHSLAGDRGLIGRLDAASEKDADSANAFNVLSKELKNGFLAELPNDNIKYTCTMIALEEIGFVYHEIAQGRMLEKDLGGVISFVKRFLLKAVRTVTRGDTEALLRPFEFEEDLDTVGNFERLEASIQEKLARKEKLKNQEIDELLILWLWIQKSGRVSQIHMTRADIDKLRSETQKTTDEYREEADRAHTALKNIAKDTKHIPSEALEKGNVAAKIIALTNVQEDLQLEEWRSKLLGGNKALDEKQIRKLEHEPDDVFHAYCDAEYIRDCEAIHAQHLSDEQREQAVARRTKEYEQEKRLRNKLYAAELSVWNTLLLTSIEADIHLRAAELQDAYEKQVKPKVEERWENAKVTLKDPEEALQTDILTDNEKINIVNLTELKTCDLRGYGDALSACQTYAQELKIAEEDVLHAEKEEEENAMQEHKVQENAATIMQAVAGRIAPDLDSSLQEIADGKVETSAKTKKDIAFMAEHHHVLPFAAKVDAESTTLPSLNTIIRREQEVFRKLDVVIFEYQSSNIADNFVQGIQTQLEVTERNKITTAIHSATLNPKGPSRKEAHKRITQIETLVDILETASQKPKELTGDAFRSYIQGDAERKNEIPDYAYACYDRKTHQIVFNATRLESVGGNIRNVVLTEEKRHALIDAVLEVYPHFLTDFKDKFDASATQEMRDAYDKLKSKAWVPKEYATNLDDDARQDEEMEEMLAKYAAYMEHQTYIDAYIEKHGTDPKDIQLSKSECVFFKMCNEHWGGSLTVVDFRETAEKKRDRRGLAAAAGDKDDSEPMSKAQGDKIIELLEKQLTQTPKNVKPTEEGEDDVEEKEPEDDAKDDGMIDDAVRPGAGADVAGEYVEGSPIGRQMRDINNFLIKIESTMDAYPIEWGTEDNKKFMEEKTQEYAQAKMDFQKPDSEKEDILIKRVADIFNQLEAVTKEISTFDAKARDLRDVPPKKGIKTLLYEIEWVSVNDVIEMGKSVWEDVKRQHERRRQGKIGRVGESLTSWIPKNIPYLGTLSAEFHRRDKKAEIDEVEQWKTALDDDDSYELQDMLHNPANKDQMKAILNLLASRGRIDWTDTKFWKALSKFSYYTIPEAECLRNETLREDWLRKVITDIYQDKDHYRKWKSENDSAIDSERKKFETEADRLSNLKGGLEQELNKQLRIFIDIKGQRDRGSNVTIPDDVQPHLYEEIIDYAIRNGKMSMEAKFFYLVQGIDCGLLNADRLRRIAGEHLNIFPFIDYFYTKNNTTPEIKSLAARLRESGDKNNDAYYKPGLKTTLWLELEVAREPRVQERLRKGIDRKSGEMDHDDMHFFIPRLSYDMISSMALPQGGGKQKMSSDGWRNGYIGYNSFFRSLALLSRLEQEGEAGAKFTSEDAYQVVKAVAGFVRMDGILTSRSSYGDTAGRRPTISWGEMKNSYAVVSAGSTVYQDREKVDAFVKDFLAEYTDELITDEFIGNLTFSTEGGNLPDKTKQEAAFDASNRLEGYLMKAIHKPGGIKKMKKILEEHMANFSDVGGVEELGNVEKVRKLWREEHGAPRRAAA